MPRDSLYFLERSQNKCLWLRHKYNYKSESEVCVKKKRILICDDEALIRLLLVEVLKADYDITEASDGRDVLIKLEKEVFDLLITDIKMPQVSGLEVIEHIKKNNIDMPVIICTGYPYFIDDALKTSIITVSLSKPIDISRLRQAVINLIGH